MTVQRDEANKAALARTAAADPILVDVRRAADVVPGVTADSLLAPGAPGDVVACGGESFSGSMSVFVVEDRATGTRAFSPVAGATGDPEEARLVEEVVAPVVRDAIARLGGVPLKPIFQAALKLGDEVHMRARGAGILWTTAIFPALLDIAVEREPEVRRTLAYLERSPRDCFFRLAVAASRVMAGAAHGVPASSVVTGMTVGGGELAIRVSSLGDTWFRAPLDGAAAGRLPAGEVLLLEAIGLGAPKPAADDRATDPATGFACWAIRSSLEVFKVIESETAPSLTGLVADADGALVGAIQVPCPRGCFEAAAEAYQIQR